MILDMKSKRKSLLEEIHQLNNNPDKTNSDNRRIDFLLNEFDRTT